MTLTYAEVSQTLTIIDSARETDLDLSLGDIRIVVTSWRQEAEIPAPSGAPAHAEAQPAGKPEPLPQPLHEIRASQLGYFLAAPGLQVGGKVRKGDSIGTISGPGDRAETVKASMDGRIVDLCLDDGDFVEYAQTLAMLDTTTDEGAGGTGT